MQVENCSQQEAVTLGQLCRKWYRLNRKARRQIFCMQLFKELFKNIFPEIPYGQLLIAENEMFEHFQLFFNTSVSYHERNKEESIQQNPVVDFVLCLQGVLEYVNPQGVKFEWGKGQAVAFTKSSFLRSERIFIRVVEACSFLRIDRKLMQKFKNDILRQDRDIKEGFLSNFLFCNFTPVYYMSNIHVTPIKESHQVQLKNGFIYLLYEGVIRRKIRNKIFQGTQLTKGCIINCKLFSQLLDRKQLFSEEQYQAKVDSIVISFDQEQMTRILKLNINMKKLLESKLKTIAQGRLQLSKKSTEIFEKFNERLKIQNESIQIHYSVQFKSRNAKSAQASRSFRRTKVPQDCECNYTEFITFDKYNKMIENKQKVALTKHSYINRQRKKRQRPMYTPDYEKKIKMQNKMIKLQTGKIQKISQRDSKKECNLQQLEQIKKNLFQVTHLFDQPLQEFDSFENKPPLLKKSNTFNNLTWAEHRNTRVINLKPQQYLKNQYFNEYKSKSRVRFSLKDLQLTKQQSNKQNPIFMTSTNTNFSRKFLNVRLIVNELE